MTDNLPAPYPIRSDRGFSPFERRCAEIDEAAVLISDPAAFAQVAKEDIVLDPDAAFNSPTHAFVERPDGWTMRRFTEEDGCPAFKHSLNAGSVSTVVCTLTDEQLHIYCKLKFCEKGRRVYCPIWRAKGGQA